MIPPVNIGADPASSELDVAEIRLIQAGDEVALACDRVSSLSHALLRAELMDLHTRIRAALDRLVAARR
jgi:hypothetical protein